MLNKNINNNSYPAEGRFISLEELNNMNYLGSKQLADGKEEFSNTKQWTKNMKDIEQEQVKEQQIISEIKNLEKKVDTLVKMLENYIKAQEEKNQNNNSKSSGMSTSKGSLLKEKFKVW